MGHTRTVGDVMTRQVVTLPASAPVREAAVEMRENGIGDVVVVENDVVRGVLTDRDVVVRVVAENRNEDDTTVGEVCSSEIETAHPHTTVDEAVRTMRESAIRRVPVVDDDGHPVGMVSIGDLAITEDSRSALADISAAPPNT